MIHLYLHSIPHVRTSGNVLQCIYVCNIIFRFLQDQIVFSDSSILLHKNSRSQSGGEQPYILKTHEIYSYNFFYFKTLALKPYVYTKHLNFIRMTFGKYSSGIVDKFFTIVSTNFRYSNGFDDFL